MTHKMKEFWTKLKYWQKGGVIGFVLIILINIMFFSFEKLDLFLDILLLIDFIPRLIVESVFDCGLSCLIESSIAIIILNIIQLTLIGALIGFIVGKIKTIKKKR